MTEIAVPAPPNRTTVYPWMLGMVALVAAQITYYAPRLPTRVASHFDAAGNPDGFMERTTFLVLMGGLMIGIIAMFWLILWLMPKMPASMINMPNRDYWLADERRTETHHVIARNLLGHTVLVVAFLAWLLHAMFLFNTAQDGRGSLSIWWPLGIYLGATALLVIAMYRRFRIPAEDS